jgi:hypothetical protein
VIAETAGMRNDLNKVTMPDEVTAHLVENQAWPAEITKTAATG